MHSRNLANPASLDNTYGSSNCARFATAGLRDQQLQDPRCAAGLAVALASLMSSDRLTQLQLRRFASIDERRACKYYSSLHQIVADIHRYGLMPVVLQRGDLRSALQPPAPAEETGASSTVV